MWSELGAFLVKLLHSLTGWMVHPDKGGCCDQKSQKITEMVADQLDKTKNRDK